MEGKSTEANSYDSSYQSTANWRVSGGSVLDTVAFESSISCAADDNDGEDQNPAALAPKAPLLLFPPSPDSEPCEISITFSQKHEVRQVYVRSTARVYEIYYATKLRQSNEYLCTVRCGIAMRDDAVLQAPCIEEAGLADPKEPSSDLEVRKAKDNGNGGMNEDEWVEVKASDVSLLSKGKNASVKPQGIIQDFYEASAEINDAEPCITITIRLLSLQDKGCLFVDEVFIFADPVDPTDSGQEVGGAESSASSSLMAMFMPTLLQLSRAKDATRLQDTQPSDEREKNKTQETLRTSDESAETVNEIRQEMQTQMNFPGTVGTAAKPAELETSAQVPGAEIKSVLPSNHTEYVLQQLVSRVGKIEDILSRFEERLLIPICSIDARLQQVEHKLEELTKKSQNPSSRGIVAPEFPCGDTDPDSFTNQGKSCDVESDELSKKSQNQLLSCTRISAPEFSCSDANFDSSSTNESKFNDIESSEYKDGDTSTPNPSDDLVDPRGGHNSFPEIEEVALKSENSDDKEENHSLVSKSPKDKPKQSLSINDALATALAGFLSSSPTVERMYTQALVVKAPEFSNEEDSGNTDRKAITDARAVENANTSACSGTEESLTDSVSSSSCISYTENEAKDIGLIEHNSEKMTKGVDEHFQHNGGDSDNLAGSESDNFQVIIENGGATNLTVDKSVPDDADDPDMSMQKGVLNSGFVTAATEVKETPTINDVLHSILGFSHASSSVDFKSPILDVKFNSQKTSNGKSSIDALFGSSPESNAESATTAEFIPDGSQCNLILVDDGEIAGPPTNTLVSVDMSYWDISDSHLNLEVETQHDCDGSRNEEMPVKDLI